MVLAELGICRLGKPQRTSEGLHLQADSLPLPYPSLSCPSPPSPPLKRKATAHLGGLSSDSNLLPAHLQHCWAVSSWPLSACRKARVSFLGTKVPEGLHTSGPYPRRCSRSTPAGEVTGTSPVPGCRWTQLRSSRCRPLTCATLEHAEGPLPAMGCRSHSWEWSVHWACVTVTSVTVVQSMWPLLSMCT